LPQEEVGVLELNSIIVVEGPLPWTPLLMLFLMNTEDVPELMEAISLQFECPRNVLTAVQL
jgi:hypothetical protein